MAEPVKIRKFHPTDMIFIGLSVLSLTAFIVALKTPGNETVPLAAWVIFLLVIVGFFSLTVLLYVFRFKLKNYFKYQYKGVIVTWNDENTQSQKKTSKDY